MASAPRPWHHTQAGRCPERGASRQRPKGLSQSHATEAFLTPPGKAEHSAPPAHQAACCTPAPPRAAPCRTGLHCSGTPRTAIQTTAESNASESNSQATGSPPSFPQQNRGTLPPGFFQDPINERKRGNGGTYRL